MKKNLFLTLAAACAVLAVAPAEAATQYKTHAEAQANVTDDGYILFVHPAGWDRYGEKLCKKLIANSGVRAAAGNAALILAPIYQNRTESNNARAREIMGPLGYPHDMGDISYPAILFYEKGGRMYATVHGEALMTASEKEVAALVRQRMEAKKKQDSLLARSREAKNAGEKSRLLLESSRVDGIDWPAGLQEAMRQADPQDAHGYQAALNFGFGLKNGESMKDFLARLDAVLKNERLSAHQKQRACAVALGHIRRSYGMIAGGPFITKYARAMRKLDPKSPLGLSAPVVMRDWVRTYSYGQGWSDGLLPAEVVPVTMHNVPMTQPGTYTVTFNLVTGRDGIKINQLRLMDGKRCVAADTQPREVSWGNTQQTYTFTVKKPLKKAALEITYGNDANHRSSWGNITVKKQ